MYRVAITSGILFGILVTVTLLGFLLVQQKTAEQAWALEGEQQFYFVTLSNNQVFVGKIVGINASRLTLSHVFYLQSSIDQNSQEVSQKLVNRSNELHQPTQTDINMDHVLMVEPVKSTSKLAQLLVKAKTI